MPKDTTRGPSPEGTMPPTSPPPASCASSRPPRILIADDNPQGVELLEAYLSTTDCLIETATDGEETWRKLKEWQPDLILLDIMMPRISGFEVCKRLRADPATRQVGVLMITALDQPSDVERAVEAGTDDFLTKPINKEALLLRVRSILKSRLQPRDLDRALDYIQGVDRPPERDKP
jgi:CheY-like chemotaxis protein